jgi:hypothetical protein
MKENVKQQNQKRCRKYGRKCSKAAKRQKNAAVIIDM